MSKHDATLSAPLTATTAQQGLAPKRAFAARWLVLLTSVIPAFGLLFWHWDAYYVALALWLDGAAKLLFGTLQVLCLPRPLFERLKIAVVLSVFFSGFVFGHLIAIIALLAPDAQSAGIGEHVLRLATDWLWQLVVVVSLALYAWSFITQYLAHKPRREDLARLTFKELNVRIFVIQIGVLVVAMLILENGMAPTAGLVGLILAKAISDAIFEYKAEQLCRQSIDA